MMLSAAIAFVDEDLFRLHSGKLFYLRVGAFERVPIVGIPVQRRDAYYPTALGSRHHRYLATELVLLVLFPFRDAFNFRRLHAVELVLVCPLLPIDARRSPQVSAQLPRLSPRPFQLLRVRVTSLLL